MGNSVDCCVSDKNTKNTLEVNVTKFDNFQASGITQIQRTSTDIWVADKSGTVKVLNSKTHAVVKEFIAQMKGAITKMKIVNERCFLGDSAGNVKCLNNTNFRTEKNFDGLMSSEVTYMGVLDDSLFIGDDSGVLKSLSCKDQVINRDFQKFMSAKVTQICSSYDGTELYISDASGHLKIVRLQTPINISPNKSMVDLPKPENGMVQPPGWEDVSQINLPPNANMSQYDMQKNTHMQNYGDSIQTKSPKRGMEYHNQSTTNQNLNPNNLSPVKVDRTNMLVSYGPAYDEYDSPTAYKRNSYIQQNYSAIMNNNTQKQNSSMNNHYNIFNNSKIQENNLPKPPTKR